MFFCVLQYTISPHLQLITHNLYKGDFKFLFSLKSHQDGTVRFWDYTKGEQLHRLSLNELEGRTTGSDAGASSAAAGDGSENGNGDSKSNSSGAGDGGVTAVKDKLATVICIACCRKHKLVAASVLK